MGKRLRGLATLCLVALMGNTLLNACSSGKNNEANTAALSASDKASDVKGNKPVKLKILTQDNYETESTLTNPEHPISKKLQEVTGTKIEWNVYPPSNFQTTMTTRMASGVDLPDIVFLGYTSDADAENYVKQGLIVPLNELIDKYAPHIKEVYNVKYPGAKKQATSPDGQMYWLSYVGGNSPGTNEWGPIIREDWLNKVGITKLPETTDEFYDALKAMRDKDANGNGKKDEVLSSFGFLNLSFILAPAFGVKNIMGDYSGLFGLDESGKLYNEVTSDNYKKFLMYVNKLHTANLLDDEFTQFEGYSYDKWFARLQQNTFSATAQSVNYAPKIFFDTNVKVEGVKHTPLMPLKGPDGHSGSVEWLVGIDGSKFAITKDCKDPVAAMKFLDYLYSDEGYLLIRYGIEGVNYQLENGVPVPINLEKKDKGIIGLPTTLAVKWEENIKAWKMDTRMIDVTKAMINGPRVKQIGYAIPTDEESKAIEEIGKDLDTYIKEMITKFWMGEESFDNWDKFAKRASELGLDKAREVYQKMHDRFENTK